MKLFQAVSFAVLLASVSAVSAHADLSCPGLTPRPFTKIETQIDLGDGSPVIVGKNIDCSKVAIGANVVTGIQKMLGRDLPAPSALIFRMVDQFDNAFFDPREISLNVPYQLVLNTYSKNPVYSPAIWAHEFGHAVLDNTFVKAMPKWTAYINRSVTEDAGSAEDVLQLLLSPYHEYFADVVAVLYTGKPDAVARGLFMTGFMANPEGSPKQCPNKSSPDCRPKNSTVDMRGLASNRDFADRSNQLGTWRGVNPLDDHNLLAPARFHIWKYYLSNALIKYQKGKMASTTVDAIMDDLNGRLKRIASMPGGFTRANISREIGDVQRINREFMQTLDVHFKTML